MKYELDIKGLDGVLKTLESLPAEIVSKAGGPVKNALRKGAKIFREEELTRFKQLVNQNGENDTTGLLEKSIIIKRSRPNQIGAKGERYIVTFAKNIYFKSLARKIKALSKGNKSETVTVLKTAQLFEYGSSHQPPRKFIYPAFTSKAGEVMDVIRDDVKNRVDSLVRKLAKQNKTGK